MFLAGRFRRRCPTPAVAGELLGKFFADFVSLTSLTFKHQAPVVWLDVPGNFPPASDLYFSRSAAVDPNHVFAIVDGFDILIQGRCPVYWRDLIYCCRKSNPRTA